MSSIPEFYPPFECPTRRTSSNLHGLPTIAQDPDYEVALLGASPVMRRGIAALFSDVAGPDNSISVDHHDTAGDLTFRSAMVIVDATRTTITAPVQICSAIRKQNPRSRILVIVAAHAVDTIRECLEMGAVNCVADDSSESELAEALIKTLHGRGYLDPRIAYSLLEQPRIAVTQGARLTPRERDVLQLLQEGCSNRVISRKLTISEATVKGHVSSLLAKLGAPSRLAAAVMATALL